MSDSLRGVSLMLVATLSFAIMNVFVKLMPDIPPMQVVFFRSLFALAVCQYFLTRARIPVLGKNRPLLVMRGLTGALALVLNFYLIQQIPLAAASTINYLAPIFTIIIGIFYVREKVSFLQFVFFAISFSGILVVQGFDTRVSIFHLLVGISSSMLMGVAYNCVRKLTSTEHSLVIMYYFPLLCLPMSIVGMMFGWHTPEGLEWLYLFMVGLMGQLAQYFLTWAFQTAEIATVSIASYSNFIFSIAFGFVIFSETYNLMIYLGMLLVVVGIILNILWKRQQEIKAVLA